MSGMKDLLGDTPYEPITMEEASAKAALGMERVATKAGSEWCEEAYDFLVSFLLTHHDRFMTEDVVEASRGIVPEPHDRRAWGPVMSTGARRGIVQKVGYAPARTSNTSPKVQWLGVRS